MSTSVDSSVVARWRLILGQSAEEQLTVSSGNTSIHLSEDELIMDQALAAIYDETSEIGNSGTANTAALDKEEQDQVNLHLGWRNG